MNKNFKYASGGFLILSSIFFTGCATAILYSSYKPKTYKTTNEILVEDEMIAIGQPAQIPSKPSHQEIIFIGKKYTYLILDAEEFTNIVKKIPVEKLIINPTPLKFRFENDNEFRGYISLQYVDPLEKIPEDQLKILKALNFTPPIYTPVSQKEYLTYTYAFTGKLYEPLASNKIQHKFSKPYSFQLFKETHSTHVNKRNIRKTKFLTPLAITFDVIISPVWGGFLLACSFKHTSCIAKFN